MEGQFRDDLTRFSQTEAPKEKEVKKQAERITKAQAEAMKQLTGMEKARQEEEAAQYEGETRASLVRKIELYYKHFGDKISTPMPKKLSLKTRSEDLQAVVAAIEADLGMTGGMEGMKQAFAQTGLVIEAITQRFNPLGLQLSGPISLAATMEANRDKWDDLATELAIKYERRLNMSVEVRCIQFIAVMVWTVHRANKAGAGVQRASDKGKREETVPSDLFEESKNI